MEKKYHLLQEQLSWLCWAVCILLVPLFPMLLPIYTIKAHTDQLHSIPLYLPLQLL